MRGCQCDGRLAVEVLEALVELVEEGYAELHDVAWARLTNQISRRIHEMEGGPGPSERYRLEQAALEYAVHRPELVTRSGMHADCLHSPVLREAFAALEQADTLEQAIAAVGPNAELALRRAIQGTDGFTPWVLIRGALLHSTDCVCACHMTLQPGLVPCPSCSKEAAS